MRIWVYIFMDKKDDFVIGLTPISDNSESNFLVNLQVIFCVLSKLFLMQ